MSLLTDIGFAQEWMVDANCKNMDINLFFTDGTKPYDPFVKEVCMACPVIDECAWYANETAADHGIFGGMTPSERRLWRRKNNAIMGQSQAQWEAA